MASSKGIRAGRAFVEIFADRTRLTRGLRVASQQLKRFGNGVRTIGLQVAGIGVAVLAPIGAAALAFSRMGDAIAKMSRRTGFSVEALSGLQFAASQSGTSIESLEKGIRRMQMTIIDAERGLSTAKDGFEALGLAVEDLSGKAPEDQFKLMADGLAGIEDPTKRAATAMMVFGRAGTALLPMFANGAAGIEELMKKARSLGLIMSKEDAVAAEIWTDSLDQLTRVLKMGVFRVGAALAPVLTELSDKMTRISVVVGAWIEKNREVIVMITKVAAVVVGVGLTLVVLGSIIGAAGVAIGLFITIIGAILSPIGLVIAAVAALGFAIAKSTTKGMTVLQTLGAVWEWIKGVVINAISAIVFAVKNWKDVVAFTMAAAAFSIVRFAGQVKHFFVEVIPATLKFFWENWRDIFITMGRFTKAVALNIGRNLANLWAAIKGFATGKGWQFKWTPLLDGFESAIKTLPEIAEREIGPLETKLRKNMEKLGRDLQTSFAAHDEAFREQFAGESPEVAKQTPEAVAKEAVAAAAKEIAKIGVTGTFQAQNVLGLQAGGAADRMVTGIEKIVRNTQSLRNAQPLKVT